MEIKHNIVELFEPKFIAKLILGCEAAISESLETDKVQNLTKREVKRRFDILMNWAVILRGDLGWGTARIVKSFPHILKTELSGTRWEPGERLTWVTGDGL